MRVGELLLAGQSEGLDDAVETADASDIAAVLELVGHDNPEVRRAVASTLPLLTRGDPPTSDMIAACIRLSTDPVATVRDWACTALGSHWREIDTEDLRGALAARLADEDSETRCEALLGLAYRRDPRALPKVREALGRESGELWFLELEAAGALSDPSLHELVLPHVDGWGDPEKDLTGEAVRRLTSPDGPGEDLISAVAQLYRHRAHSFSGEEPLSGWELMLRMLDIAPDKAQGFYDAVLSELADDPAAERALREQSSLAQLAYGP